MPSLNVLPVQPSARQPRGAVKLNDTLIDGWLSWEVESNSFYAADTFRITFLKNMLPAERNARWFSELTTAFVEIFAGFPPNADNYRTTDLTSMLYGRVDEVEFDLVRGRIELIGRDLTSEFIDAKTTEKWPNNTASQIATDLAVRRGLTPVVTPTTTKVGTYYDIDHVTMTDQRSEWDILNYLAHLEQFAVYVRGKTLYFGPKPDPKAAPYVLQWQPPEGDRGYPVGNFMDLRFTRGLTVSRGIQVVVRSFLSKGKKSITATYPSKANSTQAGKAKPFGGTQIYTRTIPGLTQEQALKRAQSIHAELIAHEMKLTASLPGDNILGIDTMVQVIGTDTAWDQTYYPDSITRRMSFEEGYMMNLHAKNHAPDSTVAP